MSVSIYTKDISCDTVFSSFKGNHATDPFKVYLDRLVPRTCISTAMLITVRRDYLKR